MPLFNGLRSYFGQNGPNCSAVKSGISGGKDSTIVAALCKEALGCKSRSWCSYAKWSAIDIDDAQAVVNHLGIPSHDG